MIIKIDKQKVVEAAELEIERLTEIRYEWSDRCDDLEDIYEEMNKIGPTLMYFGPAVIHEDPYVAPLKKLRYFIVSCKITEEQTVAITDEDVELLGL